MGTDTSSRKNTSGCAGKIIVVVFLIVVWRSWKSRQIESSTSRTLTTRGNAGRAGEDPANAQSWPRGSSTSAFGWAQSPRKALRGRRFHRTAWIPLIRIKTSIRSILWVCPPILQLDSCGPRLGGWAQRDTLVLSDRVTWQRLNALSVLKKRWLNLIVQIYHSRASGMWREENLVEQKAIEKSWIVEHTCVSIVYWSISWLVCGRIFTY